MLRLLAIWSLVLAVVLWRYFTKAYSKFSERGVKHLTPVPLLGNMAMVLTKMETPVTLIERIYNGFSEQRFVGNYELLKPVVVIKDPELLKKILTKDFEHFLNHKSSFGSGLFNLTDQKWKDMRPTLSPAFTSSKIRLMVPFMVEVGDQMLKSIKLKIKESNLDYIEIDARDRMCRNTNDIIASCAFGVKVNSHIDENNEFYKMGRDIFRFTYKSLLLAFVYSTFPKVMQKLNVRFLPTPANDFFEDIVLSSMKERKAKNIIRHDMIHLLMEAKNGRLRHDRQETEDTGIGFATVQESDVGKRQVNRLWTDYDLVAQAMTFFFAGFEAVSTVMVFALHELAANPGVQDKLVQEIRDMHKTNDGQIDYYSIQRMTYMDMVVSEVLRLYPTLISTDRSCTKDYNLGRPNEDAAKDYIIRKGEGVIIPIWAIHRSAEYFPDPLKFDPERFSEENKHNIKPYTYMPFGLGPRSCIGTMLALSVLVLSAVLWLYFKQVYSRFSEYGVKHFTPVPLLGNMARITLRMEHVALHNERIYNSFPGERFVGSYEFMTPTIYIRDLELIKKITVKHYEHFVDHRAIVDEDVDPFLGRNLFAMKGHKWRDMRLTLSPAFTSSKIRLMVPFMVEVGEKMMESLKKKILCSESGAIEVESKDLMMRYANDVIASCAFGLKVDSHTDEDNLFYEMGRAASVFGFIQHLKFIGFSSCPNLMKFLLTGKLSHDTKVANDGAGFATAEEYNVGKRQNDRVWSADDLIAQAVLFFIAGFETTAVAMTFLLYELALNPGIQDRLAQEIHDNHKRNDGKFDYSSIQELNYLDMVVSESLRIWPPDVGLDRLCVKDFNLGKPSSDATRDYIIRKDEGIVIPMGAIQRDPEYFPDPTKFDPERFSDVNKHNIKPFTYMPFGLGPRNCTASRFALCEMKIMIYQLLLHIELSPSAKTCIPIKLTTDTFNLRIKGGHWLSFKMRKGTSD